LPDFHTSSGDNVFSALSGRYLLSTFSFTGISANRRLLLVEI
jgi:hypothetical protein